jgi:lysozyme
MEKEKLKAQLRVDEGVRYKPYRDSLGFLTIGVGHNLEAKPLSSRAVDIILEDDIEDTLRDLQSNLPWVSFLSENRQLVLANMCFNLGIQKLLTFKNTLKAAQEGRYNDAAEGMKNSLWATQVGARATRLIELMRTG